MAATSPEKSRSRQRPEPAKYDRMVPDETEYTTEKKTFPPPEREGKAFLQKRRKIRGDQPITAVT
jgi:hypothetical protein